MTLQSREAALSDNLASISEQIAGAGGSVPATARRRSLRARAPTTSPKARRACRAAPRRVQAAIEAANSIATTPYVWGGGHGSFDSSGLRLLGRGQLRACNGGGFLASPLDSTGLETWGEARRRAVDHRLRQLGPRLDDHRRPRLRYVGGPARAGTRTGQTRPKAS
jgi:hypothetical protein